MRRLGDLRKAKDGASAVEFALLIGPMVMALFGIVEVSRYYFTAAALQSTAVQASRCMGVLQVGCTASGAYSSTQTQTYVTSLASNYGVTIANSNVTVSNSATSGGVTGFSQVTITYTFQTVVPLVLTKFASGIPITQTACFPNRVAV
jgi:Flp pilus assembly protein TadG